LLAGEQRREDRYQDEQDQHGQADHAERALPVGLPDPCGRDATPGPGDPAGVPGDLGRRARLELDAGERTFLERGQGFGGAHQPALTLGSSREYRMSAMRLAMMTAAENSRNKPWSSGKSFESMACTVSNPRPGYEKTYSMVIAPPKMNPSESITTVNVGRNAFGTTWRHRICFSRTPLARAVMTKSSFITSIREFRMMSEYSPM